jgi:hypothetical protein
VTEPKPVKLLNLYQLHSRSLKVLVTSRKTGITRESGTGRKTKGKKVPNQQVFNVYTF